MSQYKILYCDSGLGVQAGVRGRWARKASGHKGAGRARRAGTQALSAQGERAREAGRHWAGARQESTRCRRAGRHDVGAQGRAAWRMERARHGRPRRGLGDGWVRRLGQLGQFWCTVHLAQFWLGFWTRFDSVFS